ncbi:MAG TPA: hypothetical protein VHE55_03950 [Fimbriimonadaceae bacterium]|nr:hypothetical protein [Fimbriimonadaceae bacterium]
MSEAVAAPNLEWWEKRRMGYLVFTMSIAVIGCAAFLGCTALPGVLKEGEDAVEPIGLFFGFVILPIVAGTAYRIGYVAEKYLARQRPGRHWAPFLYKLGYAFTIALFSLPALAALAAYLTRR